METNTISCIAACSSLYSFLQSVQWQTVSMIISSQSFGTYLPSIAE